MDTPTTEAPREMLTTDAAISDMGSSEIEVRAYFRYVERGRQNGFALDDWLAAEAEVAGRMVRADLA